MIRYALNDYYTLQVVDSTGAVTKSVSVWEGQAFNALELIMQAQKDAQATNSAALAKYFQDLNAYNTNTALRMAQSGPAPAKPLMTIVDDSGNSTTVPFNPPLPDPLPPPATQVQNPAGALQTITGLTQDQKLDNIMSLLAVIGKKILS